MPISSSAAPGNSSGQAPLQAIAVLKVLAAAPWEFMRGSFGHEAPPNLTSDPPIRPLGFNGSRSFAGGYFKGFARFGIGWAESTTSTGESA